MKKKVMTGILAGVLTLGMSLTAFAGQWQLDARGWWYDNGDGTWPANQWQWIDGNGDGTAECYYFDHNGYCLLNTTTPDGYTVDANGAWIVEGMVPTRAVAVTPSVSGGNQAVQENVYEVKREALMLYDVEPVIESEMYKESSASTNKENNSWSKVLRFINEPFYDAYAEFYAGGAYDSFKAVAAPKKSNLWNKENYVYLQVLGDDDEILYESDDIDYRTGAFYIDADISGQDTVSIYVIQGEGTRGPVILREARFE